MPGMFENQYLKLREAGSASDFPNILGDSLHKELLKAAALIASTWRKWCKVQPNITDFKANKRIKISETDQLLEVLPGHPAKESSFDESQVEYVIKKFERVFGIPWELLVNDDVGAIQQRPQAMGRAAGITLARFAVALLEARAASTTVTSALSETSLAAARAEFKARKDSRTKDKLAIVPKYLIVPDILEDTARRILNSTQLIAVGMGTSVALQGNYNVASAEATGLELCVEPYLSSDTDWYLSAEPGVTPGIEIGFFRGRQDPRVSVKSAGIQGNDNPFDGGDFDTGSIMYKVQHIFGGKIIDPNALLKVDVEE
jgi:hypothetical protein